MGRLFSMEDENDWTGKHFIQSFGKTRFTKKEIVENKDFALILAKVMQEYWRALWDNDVGDTKKQFPRRVDIVQESIDYVKNFYDNTLAIMEPNDTIEMSTRGGDGVEIGIDMIQVSHKEVG